MLPNDIRREVKNITAGNVIQGSKDTCTAIRNLLSTGIRSSGGIKKEFESKQRIKEEQATRLTLYAKENGLWLDSPQFTNFIGSGSEARVFIHHNSREVIKVNDGGYYATWLEYFDSICLHNLLFPNTKYDLIHLTSDVSSNNKIALHAVVKQPYVVANRVVAISEIKAFLEFNGFTNTRRNDYIHSELGVILEDMHDENVLVQAETLFFIDTVFYINN